MAAPSPGDARARPLDPSAALRLCQDGLSAAVAAGAPLYEAFLNTTIAVVVDEVSKEASFPIETGLLTKAWESHVDVESPPLSVPRLSLSSGIFTQMSEASYDSGASTPSSPQSQTPRQSALSRFKRSQETAQMMQAFHELIMNAQPSGAHIFVLRGGVPILLELASSLNLKVTAWDCLVELAATLESEPLASEKHKSLERMCTKDLVAFCVKEVESPQSPHHKHALCVWRIMCLAPINIPSLSVHRALFRKLRTKGADDEIKACARAVCEMYDEAAEYTDVI